MASQDAPTRAAIIDRVPARGTDGIADRAVSDRPARQGPVPGPPRPPRRAPRAAHPGDEPLPDPARLTRRDRAPLALRPLDRRRRHVADADGGPRGDRPRAPTHGAHHRSGRGSNVDRPAMARPGRLLRGARARRDARRDPPRDRPRLLALALATATARTSGASSRSTFFVGLLAVLAGPWGWTMRPRRQRCRSSPASSGSSSTRPVAASAGGRCSCSRCSSSGRTSTAPSCSARRSPCSSA